MGADRLRQRRASVLEIGPGVPTAASGASGTTRSRPKCSHPAKYQCLSCCLLCSWRVTPTIPAGKHAVTDINKARITLSQHCSSMLFRLLLQLVRNVQGRRLQRQARLLRAHLVGPDPADSGHARGAAQPGAGAPHPGPRAEHTRERALPGAEYVSHYIVHLVLSHDCQNALPG